MKLLINQQQKKIVYFEKRFDSIRECVQFGFALRFILPIWLIGRLKQILINLYSCERTDTSIHLTHVCLPFSLEFQLLLLVI